MYREKKPERVRRKTSRSKEKNRQIQHSNDNGSMNATLDILVEVKWSYYSGPLCYPHKENHRECIEKCQAKKKITRLGLYFAPYPGIEPGTRCSKADG